jgi:hypothetical protein
MARPEDLTVDYKKLLKLSVTDRVQMARSPIGQSYLASLTPSQYNSLFPSYYKNSVPSYSAVSSGGGSAAGGGAVSGGGGGGEATTPSTTTPSTSSSTTISSATKPAWLQRFEASVLAKVQETAGPVTADNTGRVNATSFRNSMISKIQNSRLNGFVPPDGERYGIKKGTPQEWANYFTGLAMHESGLKTGTVGDVGRFAGNSNGLFQLSPNDATTYKIQNKPFTIEQLRDPNFNADVALKIHEHWLVTKKKGILDGAGKYWGPISREGWTPGKGRDSGLPWREWEKDSIFPSGPPSAATDVQKQRLQTDDAAETRLSPEQANKTVANMATGKIPLNEQMLKNAMTVLGRNENKDTKVLMEYFRKGGVNWDPRGKNHWCGVFVQSSLAQAGVKGTKGYTIASNWLNWGHEVNAQDVKPGDVLALTVYRGRGGGKITPGATGGHVGMATGKTKVENGVLYVQMYGGNQSNAATLQWYPASKLSVRRAPEFMGDADSRQRATELESLGLNPFDAEKMGKQTAGNVSPGIIDMPAPEGYENLPEPLRKEIEAMPVDQRHYLYGLMSKAQEAGIDPISGLSTAFQASKNNPTAVVQTIQEAPPGKIPEILAGNFEVLDRSREQLSRKEIQSTKGNRVVSLDFNATPGAKGVEIVIPDDATDEEKAAAQNYVASVKKYFEDRGYKNYPVRGVRQTSTNKRGVPGFFHTEPFFSTDKEAVDIISKDPGGYASVVASTLGSLPGTKFIPPHMEESQGASIPKGPSERQFALDKLIPELRKIKEAAMDDASEKPLVSTSAPQQTAPQVPTPTPESPTATPVVSASAPPSVRFQDMDLGGAKRPNFTEAELEAINLTPGAAEKIAKGIRENPMASSIFASPSAVRSGVLAKSPELKKFSGMSPEDQQKRLQELKQKATPAPAPEQPKQEQTAPTATPAEAPAPEAAPKTEEKPKALATGGLVDIPPGEDIAGVNMKTGKTEFYANNREAVSVKNGKLKVDPASLVNNDQPLYGNVQQEPQQQQPQNMASMSSSSAPMRPNMSGVVNRFMNIHPDTPSAQRHVTQTYYDSYRRGTNFNMG